MGLLISDEYNAIWVAIDRLIKERYYVACSNIDEGITVEKTVNMLLKEVFRLYSLPVSIVSDRGF